MLALWGVSLDVLVLFPMVGDSFACMLGCNVIGIGVGGARVSRPSAVDKSAQRPEGIGWSEAEKLGWPPGR